jgi:hypothetical protein
MNTYNKIPLIHQQQQTYGMNLNNLILSAIQLI